MGISAELLVRDKLIVFDEFKATETISHVDDVFVSRGSSNISRSLFAYGMKVYIYMYDRYVRKFVR